MTPGQLVTRIRWIFAAFLLIAMTLASAILHNETRNLITISNPSSTALGFLDISVSEGLASGQLSDDEGKNIPQAMTIASNLIVAPGEKVYLYIPAGRKQRVFHFEYEKDAGGFGWGSARMMNPWGDRVTFTGVEGGIQIVYGSSRFRVWINSNRNWIPFLGSWLG
ncbi:hypothetical protein [Schlesneria paludicola]|uniref:hypothetical protein n=1 Tax=Schlesneria paludicola TaxID=360056 RepID=UPI00029AACAE|nr:hypothetical protein [Schlesneria paludicola]